MKENNRRKTGTNSLDNVYKFILNSQKAMSLTHKMRKKLLHEGYTVEKILTEYLPMSDEEKIKEIRNDLLKGVNNVYASLDKEADEKWLEQHLNTVLGKKAPEERGKYLLSLLDLVSGEKISTEEEARLYLLRQDGIMEEDDVEFLKVLVKKSFDQNAGIFSSSSVKAMEKCMEELPKNVVETFASASKMDAIAYATALYILNERGEAPVQISKNYETIPDAYMIGIIAAENIESSRLMACYYQGKVSLAVLHEKMKSLITAVITYLTENVVHLAAVVLHGVATVEIYLWFVNFLCQAFCYGPSFALIGAAALTAFVATKVITVRDCEELLEVLVEMAAGIWRFCKTLCNKLIHAHAKNLSEEQKADMYAQQEDADVAEEEVSAAMDTEDDDDTWEEEEVEQLKDLKAGGHLKDFIEQFGIMNDDADDELWADDL